MTWGFGLWLGAIIAAILFVQLSTRRRSKKIDRNTEAVASSGLNQIAEVADRQHVRRFGRHSAPLQPLKRK